jgi:glycosyltransferase involved in cell wall biosynthesis
MTVRSILLSTDAVGGVWSYTVDLAHALARLGVEPVIAAMGPKAPKLPDGLRVIETGLPLDWLADTSRDVRDAGTALARLANAVDADVLQLHSAALACDVEFERPVVAVQHSCVATWWDAVRGGSLPRDFAWRRDMVECGLNAVDAVVAPSTAFAAQTARIYSLWRSPQVVHNGRKPLALPTRTRADFVLTVGRLWDEGKNVRTLDEAAARIDAPVEAIGPLSGPNGAAERFEHLRTSGPLDGSAIAERLAARPVFASSALYEPFGLSVLEAAQAGCALVLSDIPTFRELWSGAALFVEPTDARGFADAITQLLRDSEGRDRLGTAARTKALAYTPDATARRMLQIYEQIAPQRQPAAQRMLAGAA